MGFQKKKKFTEANNECLPLNSTLACVNYMVRLYWFYGLFFNNLFFFWKKMERQKVRQLKAIILYCSNTYTLWLTGGLQPRPNRRSLRNTSALLAAPWLLPGKGGVRGGERRWDLLVSTALGQCFSISESGHCILSHYIYFLWQLPDTLAPLDSEIHLWLGCDMFYEALSLVYLFRVSLIYSLHKAFRGHEMCLKVSTEQLVGGLRNAKEIYNLPSGQVVGT